MMCAFEMTMWYKKLNKTFKHIKGTVAGVKCDCSRYVGDTDNNQDDNYSNNMSLPQLGQD